MGNLRCILDHVLPEPLPDAQHAADTARIAELEAGEPNMRHPKIQALIGGNARSSIELQLVEQILDEGAALETTAMDMEYWNSLHDRAMESMRRIAELEAAIAERNWVLHGVFNLMGGDGSEEVTGLLGRIEAILKEKTSD